MHLSPAAILNLSVLVQLSGTADPCSRRAVPVRTGSLDRRGGTEYPVFGPGDGKKMLHGPVGTEASPCWLALGAGQVALPLLAAAMAAAIR
jgi:hypothetical protein